MNQDEVLTIEELIRWCNKPSTPHRAVRQVQLNHNPTRDELRDFLSQTSVNGQHWDIYQVSAGEERQWKVVLRIDVFSPAQEKTPIEVFNTGMNAD